MPSVVGCLLLAFSCWLSLFLLDCSFGDGNSGVGHESSRCPVKYRKKPVVIEAVQWTGLIGGWVAALLLYHAEGPV